MDYGGIITFCKPTLEAREKTLENIIATTEAIEIHPYNDFVLLPARRPQQLNYLKILRIWTYYSYRSVAEDY